MSKVGIFIIGARGNVSTVALAGLCAIRAGLAAPTGMVSELPAFADAGLCDVLDLLPGGCDVTETPLAAKAVALAEQGLLARNLAVGVASDLEELDRRICTVPVRGAVGAADDADLLALYGRLLEEFRTHSAADRVIVINLTSTERSVPHQSGHESPEGVRALAGPGRSPHLTNAMLWALAAFDAGCAFVNFTPTQAGETEGLAQIARSAGVPQAGKDGKTGETLLKTVLGPMFAARNLRVMSWLANNYLGNEDGLALADPETRATKLKSKDEALRSILGAGPHLATDIGYAPSLGDWKTAWDLIHFEGFMGCRMTMQFTWQGCDSALAAPLVLDLARFTDLGWRAGESGALDWLAVFFKSPMGAVGHEFAEQMRVLETRVGQLAGKAREAVAFRR